MDLFLYIIAGASVGFLVGVTGVGGGSLMTPLLLMFGFPPHIAVGTDLMYAAITKTGGVFAHARNHTINWQLVGLLAAGSLPGSMITLWILANFFTSPETYNHLLTSSLGIMLILTSLVLLFKNKLVVRNQANASQRSFVANHRSGFTIFMGLILGIFVTLSSVGAGAIGTALLMILYPAMVASGTVGTDLAHAVPLTFIAGMGHMRPVLASTLMLIGVKYAFF